MLTAHKNGFIECLLREGVLKFGSFTLKSGIVSPFFLNLGNVASSDALRIMGSAFIDVISTYFEGTTHIYGPPYKGISIATAVVMSGENSTLKMFYNRKEQKGHGEKGIFVGHLPDENSRIVMVDDVMTTGGTKREAMDLIYEVFHVNVTGVAVAVDRRRKSELEAFPIPLKSVINLQDIIDYMVEHDRDLSRILLDFYNGA